MAVHHPAARKRTRPGSGARRRLRGLRPMRELAQETFLDAGRRLDGIDGEREQGDAAAGFGEFVRTFNARGYVRFDGGTFFAAQSTERVEVVVRVLIWMAVGHFFCRAESSARTRARTLFSSG